MPQYLATGHPIYILDMELTFWIIVALKDYGKKMCIQIIVLVLLLFSES